MSILSLQSDGVRSVWIKALAASLPASVRLVEQGGDVMLIGGQGDWPARILAAMQTGQGRIVLIDPQASAAGQLGDVMVMAEAIGAQMTICETYADNPAVAQFRNQIEGQFTAATITGQGEAALADLLLQQLRLARAAGFAPATILHAAADAVQAVATLRAAHGDEAVLLRLTALHSRAGAAHHRLLTHGRTDSACLQVWSNPAARPATAFQIVGERTTEQATIYEGAHRAVLRSLSGSPLAGDTLRQWDHDAALAMSIARQV